MRLEKKLKANWLIIHFFRSSLQSPGRWTTAGEVFPVRQLGQIEINFDKNESLSGELQEAIKRLSTGIPRSSTTYSMNYRPIIKVSSIQLSLIAYWQDSPEDDECDVLKPCQSDAYLVVEAEQIRVIEPVSRAIQETIKLSNVSAIHCLAKNEPKTPDSRVGRPSTRYWCRCSIWLDWRRPCLSLWDRCQGCRCRNSRQLHSSSQRNKNGKRKTETARRTM